MTTNGDQLTPRIALAHVLTCWAVMTSASGVYLQARNKASVTIATGAIFVHAGRE
jgi:hypothetical protein